MIVYASAFMLMTLVLFIATESEIHTLMPVILLSALAALGITAPPAHAEQLSAAQLLSRATVLYEVLSPEERAKYPALFIASGKKNSETKTAQDITLFRWQNSSDFTLGRDHVSFEMTSQGQLSGLVRMIPYSATAALPSAEETEQIARTFLAAHAPDLLPAIDIHSIHEVTSEKYTDGQKEYRAKGMKMKCRNKVDGSYFWVVAGADRSVILFERDLEWSFIRGGRSTEKWIYDSWLQDENISFTPFPQ